MKLKQPSALFCQTVAEKEESLVYGCFSRPKERNKPHKVIVRPVLVKTKRMLLLEFHEKTRSITKHAPFEEAIPTLLQDYQELFFRFQDEEFQCIVQENEIRGKRTPLQKEVAQNLSHNLTKNYILQENAPIPFLIELGIMSHEGRVLPQARDKFRQINRFLEMVRDLDYKPHSLVDLGCGKAYLTFALYHYYSNVLGHEIEVTGVDIKDEVLEKCAAIALKIGFKGLRFEKGTIANYKPKIAPEMVVALHACNVASDHAITQAIAWQAKAVLIAPCCQHALYHKLQKSDYPAGIGHPLLQERYAALLTDGLRAETLEQAGYSVQIIEFIDPEHTPKNLLIRAIRRN